MGKFKSLDCDDKESKDLLYTNVNKYYSIKLKYIFSEIKNIKTIITKAQSKRPPPIKIQKKAATHQNQEGAPHPEEGRPHPRAANYEICN